MLSHKIKMVPRPNNGSSFGKKMETICIKIIKLSKHSLMTLLQVVRDLQLPLLGFLHQHPLACLMSIM